MIRKRLVAVLNRQLIARLLWIVSLSILSVFATAQTSHADFDLCKDPPLATLPDSSPAGWLAGSPDWSTVPDVAPNPFVANPKAGIGDVYGYNFDWKVYDLGCGNDTLRDPQAIGVTSAANIAIQWPSAWAALEDRMHDLVYASPMKWVQEMTAKINGEVADKLWKIWFPVSVIATGGWLVLRSRRAHYAETTKAIGVVIIVAAAAIFFLNYPTRSSDAMDKLANTATTLASAPFSGTDGTDAIARNVLYPQWLQGEFGSATSPTATKYGPDLFWATHYTWSEYKQVRADQKNLKIIDDRKGQLFEKVAKEIETSDPVAYGHLTGKDPEARLQAAIMAYPFVIAATLFMMVAFLMLAVSKVMLQAFVIAVPLISIPAVHPKGWGLLMSAWDLFTAAIFAALKFALLGGLFSLFLSAVLTSGRSPVEQLFWLVLISVVAFAISRPFQSLKAMTPGLDPNRSYARAALSLISSFGGARSGASGTKSQETTSPPGQVQAVGDTAGQENNRRAEDESLGALPSPLPRSPATIGSAQQQVPRGARADSAAMDSYAVHQVFTTDEEREPQPAGLIAVNARRTALETAPVEAAARPSGDRRSSSRSVAAPADGAAATPTVFTRPAAVGVAGEGSDVHGDVTSVSHRRTDQAKVSPDGSTASRWHGDGRLTGGELLSAGGAQVASGAVLAEEEVSLYRSGDDADRQLSQLRPAEVQIDSEGNETHLIYQTVGAIAD